MHTNYTNNEAKLLFPDLSYKITGICFKAHNTLGRFAREKQYADLIENELKQGKINYTREFTNGNSGNILDFIVNDCLILELKAKRALLKEDYYQIQRYLQSTKLKLGLLINFRNRFLRPKRIVRIDTDTKTKFV